MSIAWRDLPPLPQALAGQFTGVLEERLVVAGGTFWEGSPWEGGRKMWTSRIFALASVAGDWSVVGDLPEPLAYGAAVCTGVGMICLGGQKPDGTPSAACYRLRWKDERVVSTRLLDLPEATMMMGAAITRDTVYLAGGLNVAAPLSSFWSIPAADLEAGAGKWTVLPPWPGPPRFFPQMAAGAGTVYLAGGTDLMNGCRLFLQDAFAWDGDRWTVLPQMPAPAQAGLAAALDGEYFVFGGNDGSLVERETELRDKHPGFRRSIWKLSRGQWRDAGELPGSFVTTGLARWNGELVIAGGEDRPGHRTARAIAGRKQQEHL